MFCRNHRQCAPFCNVYLVKWGPLSHLTPSCSVISLIKLQLREKTSVLHVMRENRWFQIVLLYVNPRPQTMADPGGRGVMQSSD